MMFLKSLNLADNQWDMYNNSDVFDGVYHNVPFLFVDTDVFRIIRSGKNSVRYDRFKGQIILMPSNMNEDLSFAIELSRGNNTDYPPFRLIKRPFSLSNPDDFLPLRLRKNKDPKNHYDSVSQYMCTPNVSNMLSHICEKAKCDEVGFIFSNGYMVGIFADKFDPFEAQSSDFFRSSESVAKRVQKQVSWLESIVAPMAELVE